MKTCSGCGQTKSGALFYRDRRQDDGLMAECKECRRQAQQRYYRDHHDRELARMKRYREANRSDLRARAQSRRLAAEEVS